MNLSHARTKPVVVERIKRRALTQTCPSCGVVMKFYSTDGKPTLSCPRCRAVED
jgi:uncharacterized paraquat-inducible protein A